MATVTGTLGKGTKLQRQFKAGTFTTSGTSSVDKNLIVSDTSDASVGDTLEMTAATGAELRHRVASVISNQAYVLEDILYDAVATSTVVTYFQYDDVANVSSVSGPSATTDQLDITTHNNAVAFREMLPGGGLLDSGEINFSCFYDPALDDATSFNDFNSIVAELDADAKLNRQMAWRIKFPPGNTTFAEFTARVTGVVFGSPVDGPHTLDLTLKVLGDITWPA